MTQPKSILMPLSTSGQISERLQCALSVAEFFQAHVKIMHAQVSPKQFVPEGVIGVAPRMMRELEKVASKYSVNQSQELQSLFTQLCNDMDIPVQAESLDNHATASWKEISGLRSELVAEYGKLVDLIIIPKSKSGKSTSTFESAVLRSGKPVLLVPRTLTEFNPSNVLIAWNNSLEAARAVSLAMPILQRAKKVSITLNVQESSYLNTNEALKTYLERHGVTSEILTLGTGNSEDVREGFLQTVANHSFDLVVMGAFSSRRLHQKIFGGWTRYVFSNTQVPVFMVH